MNMLSTLADKVEPAGSTTKEEPKRPAKKVEEVEAPATGAAPAVAKPKRAAVWKSPGSGAAAAPPVYGAPSAASGATTDAGMHAALQRSVQASVRESLQASLHAELAEVKRALRAAEDAKIAELSRNLQNCGANSLRTSI